MPSIHTSLPSVPSTSTSFESAYESYAPVSRGPKVLNGRLVKSKPRTSSTRPMPPSALGSPSPLAEGMKEQNEAWDVNHDNDNDNDGHLNVTKEPQKHPKHSRDNPTSGNKIWKLMKQISTGGLRDKYALHSPSFSISGSSGSSGGQATLSRAAQLRVTKLSNYSEESLALSHRSHGSYGSLVASSSHASHGESFAGPVSGSAFNTFSHDHVPPPVPAIPKDLQSPQNHHLQTPNSLLPPSVASLPSSPASLSSSELNIRKHHRRDRDSRSASSPIPSIPSPLSPGQFSPASTNYSSSPPPQTPSPSPSAPKRILSRISSMGLLRRKPSIASGLAASLGFGVPASGTSGTLDKVQDYEKNDNKGATVAAQEVPALFTISTIPSTPPNHSTSKASKLKSTKYSISCIPTPSIPSVPSMSIIASSTPTKSTTAQISSSISFSSSSSRPGTGKTTLSQSSTCASSSRFSLDSRSRSMGMSASRSRSNSSDSLDSLGRRRNHRNHHNHDNHAHTTPTRNKKNSNHHRNNSNNNYNPNTVTNSNDYLYPLDKHIVPPLELSATLNREEDNRWGIEHVLSGDDDRAATSSPVSLPINEHNGNGSLSPDPPLCRRDGVSADPGVGPKRAINNRSTGKVEESKVKTIPVDKWERLLERAEKWDKLELDKLDGLRSIRNPAGIVRSLEPEELPSLPVPPRKRTKEKETESFRGEKWERSASVDVPASPVSSSPVYRGRAIVDDIPASSTFGRVMGKQIGVEGSMEENRRSSSSHIQGRASFSVVGDDGRKKNGRDGSRKRRSLSAVRPASAFASPPKDSQRNMASPSPRSWTKSLSSPIIRKNSENAADVATVVITTTPPAPTLAPRALGTLFRKLSFSGVSASPVSGTEKRRNRSPRRPSTASSISSAKARSVSISGGGKTAFFWSGDSNKQGELESLSESPSSTLPLPRRLLRKNSLLKGRSNQDKDTTVPVAVRKRPRTADALSSNNNGTLTEQEKRERWENLLERSEKAGGTIHLHANGEGLLSDMMRMSMVSTTSEVSSAQVGVPEE